MRVKGERCLGKGKEKVNGSKAGDFVAKPLATFMCNLFALLVLPRWRTVCQGRGRDVGLGVGFGMGCYCVW